MLKIRNKKELDRFLKIVSEEAVKESKRVLKEKNDRYADNFQRNLDTELSNIYEEDKEDIEDKKPADDEEKKDNIAPDKPAGDDDDSSINKNPAAEKALKSGGYDSDFSASFDSIVSSLNTLRAGRSLKDKEINTELRDYYDRLNDNESAVLLLYLKELSKILTGALEGEDAQDPSAPATYFNITKREKEQKLDTDQNKATTDTPKQSMASQGDEEDTTPPIKVNESQDISLLRKKINTIIRDV